MSDTALRIALRQDAEYARAIIDMVAAAEVLLAEITYTWAAAPMEVQTAHRNLTDLLEKKV